MKIHAQLADIIIAAAGKSLVRHYLWGVLSRVMLTYLKEQLLGRVRYVSDELVACGSGTWAIII